MGVTVLLSGTVSISAIVYVFEVVTSSHRSDLWGFAGVRLRFGR